MNEPTCWRPCASTASFLRFAVKELTDEQARTRTTVSELTLGGLVKHVAEVEAQWATFMVEGAGSAPEIDWESIDWANPPAELAAYADSHRLLDGETLEGVLAHYEQVARHTDDLVATLDLDTAHELPKAPWFEPGATLVGPTGRAAHPRRVLAARRSRRHHP